MADDVIPIDKIDLNALRPKTASPPGGGSPSFNVNTSEGKFSLSPDFSQSRDVLSPEEAIQQQSIARDDRRKLTSWEKMRSDSDVGVHGQWANGINSVVAKALGVPMDVSAWMLSVPAWEHLPDSEKEKVRQEYPTQSSVIEYMNRQSKNPVGGSDWMMNKFKEAGLIRGGEPLTPAQHYAKTGGEVAAEMLIAGGGAEAVLGRTWLEGEAILKSLPGLELKTGGDALLSMFRGTGPGSNVAMGTASGAGGEAAKGGVSDKWKPMAELGGAIGAGAPVAMGEAFFRRVFSGMGNYVKQMFLNEDALKTAAMRKTIEKTGNPQDLATALANMGFPSESTPEWLKQASSEPSFTPQAQGLLERMGLRPRRQSPDEGGSIDLVPGSRQTVFQSTGDLPAGIIEQRLRGTEYGTQAFTARLAEQNKARLDEIAKIVDPDARSEAVRKYVGDTLSMIDQSKSSEIDRHSREALDRLRDVGGENFSTAGEFGEAMRGHLDRIKGEAEGNVNTLFDSIDPGRTTPVKTGPLKTAVDDTLSSIPKSAEGPSGKEKSIYAVIDEYGDKESFGELVALRKRIINERDKQVGLNTPEGKEVADRLGTVLKGVDDTIAVQASDAARVKGASMLKPWADAVTERFGKYTQAKAAEEQVGETFGQGRVGQALAPGRGGQQFKMEASAVADGVIDKKDRFDAFVKAAGDSPDALSTVQDLAAFSMRKAAMKDGMVSPQKLREWMGSHEHVMEQFPELRAKMETATGAQEVVDRAVLNKREALEAFQTNAVNRVLGDQKVTDAIGATISKPGEFSGLVDRVRPDADATAGLKRGVVDYMMEIGRGQTTKEAGTSGEKLINGKFIIEFLAKNRESLDKLFSPAELENMNRVGRDIEMTNRTFDALKGGGGDMRNIKNYLGMLFLRRAGEHIGSVVGAIMGGSAGYASHGVGGAAVGAGAGSAVGYSGGLLGDAYLIRRMENIDRVLTDMMLDPREAQLWLAKIRANTPDEVKTFGRRLRALSANQVVQQLEDVGGR